MKLPAYPKYKPSGVEWLGDVPEHWEVKRLSYVATLKSGENITSEMIAEGGGYPVFGGNGLRGTYHKFTHRGHHALIGRQGALCGNINYASGDFWASEHALVVSPLKEFAVVWMGELLRAMNLGQYSGTAAQPGIAAEMIRGLRIPVPPLSEQASIAAFLDRETGRVDRLVAKKRELIERLKEKRTALISRTVTRGLPPGAACAVGIPENPPLKSSGLDWLGDIPEHWEVRKFSREVAIAEGQVDPEKEPYALMLLIGPEHVESATGRLLQRATAADQAAESGKYFSRKGDVIYSKIRPALRKVVIAPEDCLCSADMYPFHGRNRLDNRFIFWLLLSEQFSGWSVLESDRVAMPKINRDTLNELRMPIPPLPEQSAIAAYLDLETAKLDALVGKVEEAVERLQEYRTALITAAVNGKIDVRGDVALPPGNE